METDSLDDIKQRLERQQEQLSAAKTKLQAKVVETDERLTRVEAALSVLCGAPLSASLTTKPVKKGPKKALAPSASKRLVADLLMQELAPGHSIKEPELKSCIEHKLIESGYSRMGLALRFKEVLLDARFNHGADGISLKGHYSPSHPVGSEVTRHKQEESM